MGLSDIGRLSVGDTVNMVIFSARSYSEFLSRPQTDRVVLREGCQVDTTLPDYRELDVFVGR